MNTKILTAISAGIAMAALCSCSDKWEPNANDEGQLNLKSMSLDVDNSMTIVSRATPAVDLTPFAVRIIPSNGGETQEFTYGSMPEILPLAVGDYTVEVESHAIADAEWERPYYAGSKTFSIAKGKIQDLGVVKASFKSLRVSVKFSDELLEKMGDDCKVTVVANDRGSLTFERADTRSGYYKVIEGSTTMVATFTGTVSGQAINEITSFSDVAPGQHRIINYNLTVGPAVPDQTGNINPGNITIDTTVTDVDVNGNVTGGEENIDPGKRPDDEGEIGGGDDPTPPDPVATFTEVGNFDLDEVNSAVNYTGDCIVKIHCEKGISHLNVEIISDGLTAEVLEGVGLVSTFDLAYPANDELKEKIAGLGLPVGDQVIGKTDVDFNITDFIPLLNIYPGTHHEFVITVTDSADKQIKQSLKFNS